MPAYCAPWPVNRNADPRPSPGRCEPARRHRRASDRRAPGVELLGRVVGGPRHTARRWAKCARPALPVWQTSASDSDRRASSATSMSASAERASAVSRARRQSVSTCSGRSAAPTPPPAAPALPRATTCALVPLKPNELTPAIRARPIARPRRRARVGTATGSVVPGDVRVGLAADAGAAGSRRARSASTTLIRPAMPAAASRWPMLVLTEPTSSGALGARSSPSTAPSACTSIGSPSGVPGAVRFDVVDVGAARRRRAASAARMTASCAGPFGTVRPLLAAVLVDGRAADHGQDAIAIAPARRPAA